MTMNDLHCLRLMCRELRIEIHSKWRGVGVPNNGASPDVMDGMISLEESNQMKLVDVGIGCPQSRTVNCTAVLSLGSIGVVDSW